MAACGHSSTGAAAGGFLLRLLKVSSTWVTGQVNARIAEQPMRNLLTLPLHSCHLQLYCCKYIPSLHSFTAFLSSITILCNWLCQKSPYITTATLGTCLETHACLPSLSVAIFCTWMDSALLQEILKIKKTHCQVSGIH